MCLPMHLLMHACTHAPRTDTSVYSCSSYLLAEECSEGRSISLGLWSCWLCTTSRDRRGSPGRMIEMSDGDSWDQRKYSCGWGERVGADFFFSFFDHSAFPFQSNCILSRSHPLTPNSRRKCPAPYSGPCTTCPARRHPRPRTQSAAGSARRRRAGASRTPTETSATS